MCWQTWDSFDIDLMTGSNFVMVSSGLGQAQQGREADCLSDLIGADGGHASRVGIVCPFSLSRYLLAQRLTTCYAHRDGTTGTGTYSWTCPEVTAYSAIYFYRESILEA
jgi:hypothetical protein